MSTKVKKPTRISDKEREELLELYRQMLLIRRFEEHCDKAYRQDKIGGYLHLYIGEEALAVGFISQLNPDDRVLGHYRDHGYVLALGTDPKKAMAELYGKVTGLCRGKGGSMHFYDRSKNFLGGYAIVGGVIGIAAGVAFAARYQNADWITLCFFGDGAMNAGIFHEVLNMAGLWKLPVIFIVENNRYAMGTPLELHSAETNLAKRGSVYNFPSETIEAMDVLEVRKHARRIIDHVRKTREPYFVEALTYRFVGHGAADITDPGSYRTREEVEEWKKRDPIPNLARYLLENEIATQADLDAIDAEVRAIVQEAARFADESPDPPLDALWEDVLTSR